MTNEPTGNPAHVTEPETNPAPTAVTFTPEQMQEANRIAEERAQRASGAALKAYFQQQGMSEDEAKAALNAYKTQKAAEKTPEQLAQEAKSAAETQINAAKQAVMNLSARSAAVQLGVKPERVDLVLKLADMSGIEVGDDMQVDAGAVSTAVQAVLDAVPELAAISAPPSTPPANPAGNTGTAGETTPDQFTRMGYRERAELKKRNPNLYQKLKESVENG